MEEYNHWKEQIKEEKRKDKWDIAVFFACILAGAIALWII